MIATPATLKSRLPFHPVCPLSPYTLSYLHWRALHARDSERHSPVVDLVVGVVLEQSVGDLRQAQPLLAVHGQGHDADAVQVYSANLEKEGEEGGKGNERRIEGGRRRSCPVWQKNLVLQVLHSTILGSH